ncbi:hypothetical protein O9929_10830 [Vibrio lentus]|nr:hypothetical protein [Vibrio lentus]
MSSLEWTSNPGDQLWLNQTFSFKLGNKTVVVGFTSPNRVLSNIQTQFNINIIGIK